MTVPLAYPLVPQSPELTEATGALFAPTQIHMANLDKCAGVLEAISLEDPEEDVSNRVHASRDAHQDNQF
jgi:hypothetical protein